MKTYTLEFRGVQNKKQTFVLLSQCFEFTGVKLKDANSARQLRFVAVVF